MVSPRLQLPLSFPSSLLRCPACRSPLEPVATGLQCQNTQCRRAFPVVNGVPLLINESPSTLNISDAVSRSRQRNTPRPAPGLLRSVSRKMVPDRGLNLRAAENYQQLASLLLEQSSEPVVLVLGGQIVGEGMEELIAKLPRMALVETDVAFGPRTAILCDAHDLPFAADAFDAVIIQGVLQYVVEPVRCVAEIHRVLKPQALVYAETGFMQQVNVGAFDFMRFTHMGHRRLFRWFEEVSSGTVCGPGMALGWAYEYFLTSFFESRLLRSLASVFARYTSFYLKYLDSFLISKRGALDAASAVYFLGKKTETPLPDASLAGLYRGLEGI